MPCGFLILVLTSSRLCPVTPSSSNDSGRADSGKILRTTFSPKNAGKIDTRSAIKLSFNLNLNRPSCGILCSSILSWDRILIRAAIAGCIFLGKVKISRSAPSIRNRTKNLLSKASKWTSEAPSAEANSKIVSKILITGRSAAILTRSFSFLTSDFSTFSSMIFWKISLILRLY